MTFTLSVSAALGCMLCNGAAAILQKVSADQQKPTHGLKFGLLWRLMQDVPYASGIILDAVGWGLTFVAVQYLPLYFVESIVAASIGITALLERFFLHKALSRKAYMAIMIVFAGLVCLSVAASTGKAHAISHTVSWALVLAVIPLAGLAAIATRLRHAWASFSIAVLSGIAFGQTSVLSRTFRLDGPLWHILLNPFTYGLAVFGILGVLLFSIALQRMRATVTTATMTVSQTVVPTIIGLTLFGDEARNGLGWLLLVGLIISLVGVVMLCMHSRVKM